MAMASIFVMRPSRRMGNAIPTSSSLSRLAAHICLRSPFEVADLDTIKTLAVIHSSRAKLPVSRQGLLHKGGHREAEAWFATDSLNFNPSLTN